MAPTAWRETFDMENIIMPKSQGAAKRENTTGMSQFNVLAE